LRDYGVGEEGITAVIAQLEKHGLKALGEQREVTLEVVREILVASL
jgi:NADP-dependent alcohol dehydrogenase